MATGVGPGSGPDTHSWSDEVDRADAVRKSGDSGGQKSYAALLSSNLPSVWNKNVLEIVLEKDARGSFNVSEEDCAKVMSKLGLDSRPGVHVESVQICPNGRGVLLIKKRYP